jgi:hypothetical protein
MKKRFLFPIIFLCLTAFQNSAMAQTTDYYLGVFSNTTNTIKFTIGVYPNSVNQSKKNDGTLYTAMRVALVNNEFADTIKWNDFKIYILLKDGTLFYNFLTNAQYGEYACKYQVAPGTTHMQYYCYDKIFIAGEVDKVWLCFSDSEFKPLFLFKDEVKNTEDKTHTQKQNKK